MDTLDHIQRAIDWIEENLRAEITLEEAAREAGFSAYHFSRLFTSAAGIPLMQLVTRRRLLRAAYDISQGMRIIDAALLYGFDSASGFTRAFRREFGMPPREYARSARPLFPTRFILKELKHIMISKKLIDRALAEWEVSGEAQSIIHSSGARSENTFRIGSFLLSAQPGRAQHALSIAAEECLLKAHLPSVRTIPSKNHQDIVELDGLFFRLTTLPRGAFIPAQQLLASPDYARKTGAALARLHKALQPLASMPEMNRPDLMRSTLDWSLPESARAMNLSSRFIGQYAEAVSRLFPALPTALIHRNPTPDAFLFESGEVSSYANFEMAEVNIRLFDVCYAATAVLSETLGRVSEAEISRWPDMLACIVQGYASVSALTPEEKESVRYVVLAVQLLCVAFFSSQEQFRPLAEVNMAMTRRIINWLLPEL